MVEIVIRHGREGRCVSPFWFDMMDKTDTNDRTGKTRNYSPNDE